VLDEEGNCRSQAIPNLRYKTTKFQFAKKIVVNKSENFGSFFKSIFLKDHTKSWSYKLPERKQSKFDFSPRMPHCRSQPYFVTHPRFYPQGSPYLLGCVTFLQLTYLSRASIIALFNQTIFKCAQVTLQKGGEKILSYRQQRSRISTIERDLNMTFCQQSKGLISF